MLNIHPLESKVKEVWRLENETLTHSQAIKSSLLNNIWYCVLVFLAGYTIVFFVNYALDPLFGKAAVTAIVPALIIGLVILIVWGIVV